MECKKKPSKSLFYLAKHKSFEQPKVENNCNIKIDWVKDIFHFDEKREKTLILACDFLEGACSVSNPLRNAIQKQDLEEIKNKHLSKLFNCLNINEDKRTGKTRSKPKAIHNVEQENK